MKNINTNDLKTCIFLDEEKFRDIFRSIFDDYDIETNNVDVEISPEDGIYFCAIDNATVYKKLAEYFDIDEITSIHVDQTEYPTGVWICYKDANHKRPEMC